ncbi:MAG TPA: DUF6106 family protein [Oscillospiraceae bacterium]|nr:DUF6106 family protein [Oscillospiraceae bacterium]
MDVFVEQIVKKKYDTKDYLIMAGIILGAFVLLFACFFVRILAGIGFFLAVGVLVGAYYLIVSRNLEFEYSVTNGDVTIDKIINRSKRKRVISFDAHGVEEMGKYDEAKHQGKSYEKRLFTGDSAENTESWYMTFHSNKTGYTLLVFTPNEKVLTAIKPFLPHQVMHDAFGR